MELIYVVILWTVLWICGVQPQLQRTVRQYSWEFLMQWDAQNRVDMQMDDHREKRCSTKIKMLQTAAQ